MNSDSPGAQFAWTVLAAVAGAVTALSSRPLESMTRWQIGLSFFVSASFAIFVGPLLVRLIFGVEPPDIRLTGAVYYLLATGSNVLVPLAVRRLSGFIGVKAADIPDDLK